MRLGKDPDSVHDARVAVRRLRSHLRTFRRLVDREWSETLRGELAWLGDAIGEVRDAEVLRDRLSSRLEEIDPGGPATALIVALESRRVVARRQLLAAMGSARYRSLIDELAAATTQPRGPARRAARPAERGLTLMQAPWKRLSTRVATAGPDASDELLHRIRIDAKRVRYAAEAFVPVAGKGAARFAKSAGSLQEVLGEHQDAVTTARWLRDQGARAEASSIAFGVGRLAEIEERERAAARAAWPRTWRALERRKRFWP